MDTVLGSDVAKEIAEHLMSPHVQWVNWLVLAIVVVVTGLLHVAVAWLKKSAEIKAVTERLDEVLRQVAATTRVQEEIKQRLADSIWKDQRRWELEADLYKSFLITLGNRRRLLLEMKRVHPEDDAFDALMEREAQLVNEQSGHFQLARILMPAVRFLEIRDILTRNFGNPMFAEPPEEQEQFHNLVDAQLDVFVDAENALAAHARERLGTNIDIEGQ